MKLRPVLKSFSSQEWVEAVLNDFDAFLIDHADGERKASAMAMGLVAKYPNRVEMIPDLIDNAIEELEHLRIVYELMEERGLQLTHSLKKDEYVARLVKMTHDGREEKLLDRLLLVAVMETRGQERFFTIEKALKDPKLKAIYHQIGMDEDKHGYIFVDMALNYFDKDIVKRRMEWWVDREQEVFESLPIRAAIH